MRTGEQARSSDGIGEKREGYGGGVDVGVRWIGRVCVRWKDERWRRFVAGRGDSVSDGGDGNGAGEDRRSITVFLIG